MDALKKALVWEKPQGELKKKPRTFSIEITDSDRPGYRVRVDLQCDRLKVADEVNVIKNNMKSLFEKQLIKVFGFLDVGSVQS